MLLPYTSGFGHFQQKSWPAFFRPISFPLSHVPTPYSTPALRMGLDLRNAPFRDCVIQRPPSFPELKSAVTVRSLADTATKRGLDAPTISNQCIEDTSANKKKVKIFRPWDDERNIETESTKSKVKDETTPSKTTVLNLESPGSKLKKESILDEVDESKNAFEIFATNLGKSPDGHRCIYCGKVYSRKYGLKIHLRTHTGFKPLKCKVCQRPFGDPSNLNKHVRLHADILSSSSNELKKDDAYKPNSFSIFKCPFCERHLVRKRDLERHLASRHPNEHVVDVERV